ncbi:histone deacetylase family protein [Thermococcus sp. 2319x1]|uniref:histone deacetylase family protein n=1 Tax=Thermococcus sp. 2319x1 TaxID=1674923 RepID=UPI001583DAF8|nr:histone deacetylase family protein [Thermococcus sp. 2319x1]
MEILYSEVFKEHKPLRYHPENPERLELAIEGLRNSGLWMNIREPPEAKVEKLLRVHSEKYVEMIRELSKTGFSFVDPDTYVSQATWKAALKAFGAAVDAARLALKKKDIYLALVRPPGHHAGKNGRAFKAPTLGFCIFNNSAGAALEIKDALGDAVVVDFDVHHGNGTQEIFWDDNEVVHIDIHEKAIYPGSGEIYDVGGKGAEGSKVNIPMPHYSKDDDYILAWREIVLPILEEIAPRVIVVSAGFDAFKDDGLATMELSEEFYQFAGASLSKFSLAVVLEGGYSVGLKRGLPAFIRGYISGKAHREGIYPGYEAVKVVEAAKEIYGKWWRIK